MMIWCPGDGLAAKSSSHPGGGHAFCPPAQVGQQGRVDVASTTIWARWRSSSSRKWGQLTDRDQIIREEALKLDPDCEAGDELGVKVDTGDFGRIAAQSAKQVIIQRMKDAERDIIYEDFKDRKGEIINGIVQRFDKGAIVVNLGRTEAVLPPKEQVPREGYRPGDRVRAFVLDVKRISRGPQIILSRTHPGFIEALFDLEVPEIAEHIVAVEGVARERAAAPSSG